MLCCEEVGGMFVFSECRVCNKVGRWNEHVKWAVGDSREKEGERERD